MGFFSRKKSDPKEETIKMIEDLLKGWKIDPTQVKDKERDIWYLIQGSADFHIQLFTFDKGGDKGVVDCLEVGAKIMKLPEENFLPLYRRLLELNSDGPGCYFAIRGNLVMLLVAREIEGLDPIELKALVDDVRLYADYWDDKLIEEFGGSK